MLTQFVLAVVAFLNAGEVWTVPVDGGTPVRVTRTGARVEDFRISRDGTYLAYSRRIQKSEDRPITSIVVICMATGAVLTEIRPKDGWLDLDGWIGTTLVYHGAAAMEVTGFFEYDPGSNTTSDLSISNDFPMERDISRDQSIRLFVDDTGLGPTYRQRLHVVNTRTGATEIDAAHRSVMSPAFSPDGHAVAFVEVVNSVAGTGPRLPTLDRVWVHRAGGIDVMIHERPVQAKGGGRGITWSLDGSRIAMNYGATTYVLDPNRAGAAVREVRGHDACWISGDQLVVTTPNGSIAVLDVATGAQRILAQHGTTSQCSDAAKLASEHAGR